MAGAALEGLQRDPPNGLEWLLRLPPLPRPNLNSVLPPQPPRPGHGPSPWKVISLLHLQQFIFPPGRFNKELDLDFCRWTEQPVQQGYGEGGVQRKGRTATKPGARRRGVFIPQDFSVQEVPGLGALVLKPPSPVPSNVTPPNFLALCNPLPSPPSSSLPSFSSPSSFSNSFLLDLPASNLSFPSCPSSLSLLSPVISAGGWTHSKA